MGTLVPRGRDFLRARRRIATGACRSASTGVHRGSDPPPKLPVEYEGEVDVANDLAPLCANCHAMAHRRRETVTSIEELRDLIKKAKT